MERGGEEEEGAGKGRRQKGTGHRTHCLVEYLCWWGEIFSINSSVTNFFLDYYCYIASKKKVQKKEKDKKKKKKKKQKKKKKKKKREEEGRRGRRNCATVCTRFAYGL